ncbi:MAG: hypothetical protein EOO43_21730, partial [Flavobacterium sp.]
LNSSRFLIANHLKGSAPPPPSNSNPEKPGANNPNNTKVVDPSELSPAKEVQKEINNLLNFDSYPDLDPTLPAHLLLVVHGVGAKPDILLMNLLKIRNAINMVRKTKMNQLRAPIIIKMIDWKSALALETKERIEKITLKSNKRQRIVLNEVPADILFYLTEDHAVAIINEVASQANYYHDQLSHKFPGLKVSILAHSLGSVICYDLITGNKKKQFPDRIKEVNFPIEDLFVIGSPLGIFVSLTPVEFNLLDKSGYVKGFYNIFHPNDLVAYRIEPLISGYPELDPSEVPYMKNDGYKSHTRKKINEKLKELQGAFDSALIASLTRYDYVLQEGLIENMFETIGILGGHWGYWESTDLFYFIMKKLHSKEEGPPIPSHL